MSLLINSSIIRDYWNLSPNIDESRVDHEIRRAQEHELKELLGEPLYHAMLNDFIGSPLVVEEGNFSNATNFPNPNGDFDWQLSSGIAIASNSDFSISTQTNILANSEVSTELIPQQAYRVQIYYSYFGFLQNLVPGSYTISIQCLGLDEADNWSVLTTLGQITIDYDGSDPFPNEGGWIDTTLYITSNVKKVGLVAIFPTTPDFTTISLTLFSWSIQTGGFNEERFNTLFEGGTYKAPEFNNSDIYFTGVKQYLSGISFSRIAYSNKQWVTRSGVVEKNLEEESNPSTDPQIRGYAGKVRAEANRMEGEILRYLTHNRPDIYPEFQYKNQQTKSSFYFRRI